MAIIVPAILETTKEAFLQKLSLVSKMPGVERVQVDFGDGNFIPAKLLSADEIDGLNPAIHWEAHLMVKEPDDFLDYQISGFKTLIVHYEAFENIGGLKLALTEIKNLGLKAGLAINPDTSISKAFDFAGLADLFLVMGVVPGKQGQSFIPETINRVAELRKLLPNAIIEVDGGISMGNVKEVVRAGTDLIVAGSAIVGQENPSEAFEKLKLEINKN
jgi:ribulose-phosphate 3-epimerase